GWVIARTSWSSSTHGSSSALRFIGKLLRGCPCHRLLHCGLDIEGRRRGVHEVTFEKGFTQNKREIATASIAEHHRIISSRFRDLRRDLTSTNSRGAGPAQGLLPALLSRRRARRGARWRGRGGWAASRGRA